MSANVSPLLDPRLEHMFGLRTPLLKALRGAGDCYTVGDVADGILRGNFQYWHTENAGIVTEVISYPRKKVLVYFLVLGKLDECLGMQPEIEAFARKCGCSAVTCAGRDGWDKILPRHGFRKLWTVQVKELGP